MPPSAADIKGFVALGREQAGVEFKGAGVRTDKHFAARVVRGMLAMANRRDGGLVILGVKEEGKQPVIEGLDATQLASWTQDQTADTVAEYADPRVTFQADVVQVDALSVVVITVGEFTDVPVICKRSYNDGKKVILRDGAVYVRPHHKPESREVENYDEMRNLLETATDKEVRRFVTRAQQAGLAVGASSAKNDAAAFAAERGDL